MTTCTRKCQDFNRQPTMNRRIFIVFLLFATPGPADVRLPRVLQSHMVLQRHSQVRIWGWAEPDETVTVTADWINEKTTTTAGAEGTWQVTLQTTEAGGPHVITVAGRNTITLDDVLFGEVWLASGQSNMEMPLVRVSGAYTGIRDSAQEVADADYPQIRLFQVGNFSSKEPSDDVQHGITMYGIPPAKCTWEACSPQTIPNFAATAYFFARTLHQELKVPIGIIDSSWGGTSAETWTPASGLKNLNYETELKLAETSPQKPDQKIPTRLYNGMIHPLRRVKIKGAIWYQGEGNAGRADRYRELFSTMITEWRRVFNNDFSFYFVQIAPFNYGGVNAAYLREAQQQTLSLPKTGMAVTMDIGNLTDIHPKNKQEVGRRLAIWALAKDYESDITYAGPVYRDATYQNGQARISFDHATGGLKTRDGKTPSHFQIAGGDGAFHPATVVIDGEQLVVSSEKVATPAAVRYGFTSVATPNLMNSAGLPASPFRTDDPTITQ